MDIIVRISWQYQKWVYIYFYTNLLHKKKDLGKCYFSKCDPVEWETGWTNRQPLGELVYIKKERKKERVMIY